MWDLIVSVPDHCLSFYFVTYQRKLMSVKLTDTKSQSNNVKKKSITVHLFSHRVFFLLFFCFCFFC